MATAQDALTRARYILNDVDKIRWLDADLLRWAQMAEMAISIRDPKYFIEVEYVKPGLDARTLTSTNQARIVDVSRNVTTTSTTVNGTTTVTKTADGNAIRHLNRWVNERELSIVAAQSILHYTADVDTPNTVSIYPPATATTTAEVFVVKTKTASTDWTSNASIQDIHVPLYVLYIVHRAYLEDADYTGNQDKAKLFLTLFDSLLEKSVTTYERYTALNGKESPSQQAVV
jgi:hypothetical protein